MDSFFPTDSQTAIPPTVEISVEEARIAAEAINQYMAAWPYNPETGEESLFRTARVNGLKAIRGQQGRVYWVPEFSKRFFLTFIFAIDEQGHAGQHNDALFITPEIYPSVDQAPQEGLDQASGQEGGAA